MICYAVIDTNVLVSALLSPHNDSATVQIAANLIAGKIIPLYSREIIKEYREVLSRKKFNFSQGQIIHLLSAIEKFGISVDPTPTGAILPDMKDLPFFEVVMEKSDEGAWLVTGNIKHFPVKPFIVTPRQMLDILNGNTESKE